MRRDNLRAVVGSAVLDMRNRWVSISEISFLTEASARQISSILSQIPGIDMESQHAEWGRSIKLNADEKEAKRIWGHLMHWRYHKNDVYGELTELIPEAGWISIRDLAAEVHMMQSDVVKCVEWMRDDLDIKGTNKQMMCRLLGGEDVSEYQGTPDTGDIVSK